MDAWQAQLEYTLTRRRGPREADDSCIPVYDACTMVGTVIAQERSVQGGEDSGYTITLRPSMSYFHRVQGRLHGN
eukprot:15448992-Alexandrium_andersonii.AAC.1